jgi:4-hydroxybenzoate polyprenyltransferase
MEVSEYFKNIAITAIFLVVLGFSFLFASVYTLNNTFDHRSDSWNPSKKNPVAQEKISFNESITESMILGVIGLTFLGLVSMEGLMGGVFLSLLNIAYHVPPIRTKGRPYLDIITITLLYSTPFLIGYISINSIDLRGLSLAILFGLLSGMVHPFQTAKDIEEDRRNGDRTISVSIGVEKSISLSLALLIATMVYFELLIINEFLDPRIFFYPLTFFPSVIYYFHALAHPSNKKIDNTVLLLRLNGIFGGALPIYLVFR